jgi:hypothetical protein
MGQHLGQYGNAIEPIRGYEAQIDFGEEQVRLEYLQKTKDRQV